jgi:glutathione S-transferase
VQFYGHPFSSYTQKALIALYENGTPFDWRMLSDETPQHGADLARLWPIEHFPVLTDGDAVVREASLIIEYLDLHYPGRVRFLPADAKAALNVRFFDRAFDHYVMTPMQRIVFDYIRPPGKNDPEGVAQARALLHRAYRWLESVIADTAWIAGDFSLADCAAAPSLLYADWVEPIPDDLPKLKAYRARLLARPSMARCVEEARPFRSFFPPGAPDRD